MRQPKKTESTLQIAVLLPELLGTYGDGGNGEILAARARLRGIKAEVKAFHAADPIPESMDLYVMGGGEDTAQVIAAQQLRTDPGFNRAIAAGRPLLAICAGLQILGEWFTDGQGLQQPGTGMLDCTTSPMGARTIGELVIDGGPEFDQPLTGFENHGGGTVLGADARPLGRVLAGIGNVKDVNSTGSDPQQWCSAGFDGARQGSIIATYMHGPALARNPMLADYLLAAVLGVPTGELPKLAAPELGADIESLRKDRLSFALPPTASETR
ncbi:MAG: glutamine amidotransferase [Varibaculum sp.]|nr:glutamine amidotransferase [Varibaculum sp.]